MGALGAVEKVFLLGLGGFGGAGIGIGVGDFGRCTRTLDDNHVPAVDEES